MNNEPFATSFGCPSVSTSTARQVPCSFCVSPDSLTIKNGRVGDVITATFTVDETAIPKQIEWSGTFNEKVFVVRAIYEINGDELRYCAAQQLDPNDPKPPRPTDFVTSVGDDRTLNTLQRVKGHAPRH